MGLVYAALRPLLPRGNARYRLGMGMLFASAACPLATLCKLSGAAQALAWVGSGNATAAAAFVTSEGDPPGRAVAGVDEVLP